MKIIDPYSTQTGWITAIIEGRWVQAKVYAEPSRFGINNGRVSKCAISKTSSRDESKNFGEQLAYHYDRGLEFDELPPGLLDRILAKLEALPT